MTAITGMEPSLSELHSDARPPWGTMITAHAVVEKEHPGEDRTLWARKEANVTGIYIGYRRVHNGQWVTYQHVSDDRLDMEHRTYFNSEEALEVWLIVPGPRTNPVRALPADVVREGAANEKT